MTMAEGLLPEQFSYLEPYMDWCLATEGERIRRRLECSDEELRSFYNVMLPRMDQIAQYLNQFALDAIPEKANRLFNLAKSMMEVAHAVEYGRSVIAARFDVFRLVPMHERRP